MTGRLDGKVAIITGGAFGMGAETAKLFAAEGAQVAIGDLLEEEGAKRVAEIEAAGGQARFWKLNVTDDGEWAQFVQKVQGAYGRLDILVNNAGISGSKYDDPFDDAGWKMLMSVNVDGVFLGMKHAIPAMTANGGGAIVNLSSISGNVGQSNIHHGYNASKGAVRTITKSAAVRHAPEGIRVNSVHPGLMPPMRTSGATADPVIRAKMLKRVPMGRNGRADEVAKACLFLASDDASYVTGSELHVDGGLLAS
jgi:NAD(P)-dependent dehydrogenase (short-subunit alcohol dehydrogenase family)